MDSDTSNNGDKFRTKPIHQTKMMSFKESLHVCLCIEDLDSSICGILIKQLATGQVFDFDQPIHLELQSVDDFAKLEDLRMDVEDCAFPMIKGVSCCDIISDMIRPPDVIIVLLSNRNVSYMTDPPIGEEFHKLLSLVMYIRELSDMLSLLRLDNVKIIVAGDLALTAASVMSQKLNQLTAMQIIAIDAKQPRVDPTKVAMSRGCYSKTQIICDIVKQWWSGIKTSFSAYLGTKYINPARRSTTTGMQASGYFFSAPVNLVGPRKFACISDLHIDQNHIAGVKATTDKALQIAQEMNGQSITNDGQTGSVICLAYL